MPARMAGFNCWALLLLTMLPFIAVSGRPIPAAPPSTSSASPAPQVQFSAGLAAEEMATVADWRQFQDRSPPAHWKSLRGVQAVNRDADSIYGHRLLVGSAPPSCQGKCGSCNPCNPIHVSVGSPHGTLTQQEYYPEVWRCKCGNRLFMP